MIKIIFYTKPKIFLHRFELDLLNYTDKTKYNKLIEEQNNNDNNKKETTFKIIDNK